MASPTESFSAISPVPYDQSSALTNELKSLSERPTPPQMPPGQERPPSATPSTASLDTSTPGQTPAKHLPDVTVHDGTTAKPKPKPEENRLGWLSNEALNLGVGAAVVFGAEAIGAAVFRSPKLAEAALETAAGSTKLATESAGLASKFEFLRNNDYARVVGKSAIYATSAGLGTAARHYGYAELTGHEESWDQSKNQAVSGIFQVGLTRRIMKLTDKFWPAT
jgi:hypothetical protein